MSEGHGRADNAHRRAGPAPIGRPHRLDRLRDDRALLADDALIEVAALVTDSELNVLGEGVDIVIRRPAGRSTRCPRWSARCTPPPGCSTSWPAGTTLADAEEQVLAYVREHVPEPGKAPLCGNTVAHRPRLPRPRHAELEGYLHYRIVDVSSIKELARRWYPRAYFNSPKKNGDHRALADIRESIAELRYYREAIFVPQPGPDSDTARAIAASTSCPAAQRAESRAGHRSPDPVHYSAVPRPAIPAAPHGGRSSVGRAPGCGPGCRGFKSRHSPPRNAPRPHRRTGGVPACRTREVEPVETRLRVWSRQARPPWGGARRVIGRTATRLRPTTGGGTGGSDRGCG